MRRRTLLATGATLLAASLAGCDHPVGSLSLAAVDTDAALAKRFARPGDAYDGERGRVLRRAVAGDRPAVNGTHPLFESEPPGESRPIAYEGQYYDVGSEAVGGFQHTSYEFEVDANPTTADSTTRDVVDYEDLPDVDRAAVGDLFEHLRDAPDTGGTDLTYSPAEERESALVTGEYDAVTYEGTTYPFTVGDGEPVTVTQYRYDAAEVAADASELAARVRDRFLFALSGLSAEQREIVETAAEQGTYAGDDPPTQAFADLIDEFRTHDAVEETDYDGTWLVEYDGTVYWADVSFPESTPTSEG